MNGISFRRLDWAALGSILILILLSVLFIYSAQYKSTEVIGRKYFMQFVFALVGLGVYGFITWLDYESFKQFVPIIYVGGLVLLLAVFGFEGRGGDAHRWIELPGGLLLQSSEFAKIAVIITVAVYLGEPGRDTDSWETFFTCVGLAGLPFLLIVIEPDLSTSLMLAPITLVMMLYMGVQRKLLIIGIATVLIFATLVCVWIKYEKTDAIEKMSPERRPKIVLPRMPLLHDYQKSRIRVFLTDSSDGNLDLIGDEGWNKLQAQIAVGSGGMKGKGYLNGAQNILGFLPTTVAPTDFIFCVIAEETGFLGGLLIIGLYSILLGRCVRTAVRARDDFGRLMALGIGVMLFCHVFVNIAMTIGILPITGLPLPLMSYGGSFMVSTLIALGLVQSVYLRRQRV